MAKYEVLTIEDRLNAWRNAEQAACEAENRVANLGQAAADPRTRDLFIRSGKLRTEANRQFAAVLRAIRMDEPSA